jgi:putative Mg2+ transporter-C (MgtC) family protein
MGQRLRLYLGFIMTGEDDAALFSVLRSEFGDLGSAEDAFRVALRLLLAAAVGGLLGYNRERRGKAAGLRTYMLVSMGAALFVMVPSIAGMALADLSRVIGAVVTGIGFLGAGAIIKHRSEEDVTGLTTAASIWMTAALGMACGLGRGLTAIVSALLAWIVLSLLRRAMSDR